MKAIQEIGIKKVFKYLLFTFWEVIFNCFLFSPLRIFWLRIFGSKIGSDTIIGKIRFMNLYRTGVVGLEIGRKCFVGDCVVFDLADKIILEDDVTLSEEVLVLTHTNVGYKDHPLQNRIPPVSKKIVFKNGCFIGVRAVVMPGVEIGEQSAVGACSLVRNSIPASELHAGVPAKFIKKFE